MALFVVIARTEREKMAAKVRAVYPDEHWTFTDNVWFVYDKITSAEVADKLELSEGKLGGHGIVISMTVWKGWGPGDAWEWVNSRTSRDRQAPNA